MLATPLSSYRVFAWLKCLAMVAMNRGMARMAKNYRDKKLVSEKCGLVYGQLVIAETCRR